MTLSGWIFWKNKAIFEQKGNNIWADRLQLGFACMLDLICMVMLQHSIWLLLLKQLGTQIHLSGILE